MKKIESAVKKYEQSVEKTENVYKQYIGFQHIFIALLFVALIAMFFIYEGKIQAIIKHFTEQEQRPPIIHTKPVKQ